MAKEETKELNYFEVLNNINVNENTEKKNGLTYLSWAWAWTEVKKLHPDATYTIYENKDEWCYFTDGLTGWVKTGVTINGIEHIEYLPIMDYKNKSIPAKSITSFDVNKAIQRSLTKACARHGLGLYIYAGEDLPENEAPTTNNKASVQASKVEIDPSKIKATNQEITELSKIYQATGNDWFLATIASYNLSMEQLSKGEVSKKQVNDVKADYKKYVDNKKSNFGA